MFENVRRHRINTRPSPLNLCFLEFLEGKKALEAKRQNLQRNFVGETSVAIHDPRNVLSEEKVSAVKRQGGP